ncbi:MAG: hypothetical protein GXP32_05520 [Kiritimatiellaeota bacterium]|nr:hypothetical protein [Kiritimatiellota bacterium]
MHPHDPLFIRLATGILRLVLVVGLGCFAGAVFEYRGWIRYISFLAKPMMRLAKLPDICGTAFITAIVSNNAANSIISDAYSEKRIKRREMFLSAVANSYLAEVSHAFRIMFVIIFTLGLPGVLYFIIQFSIGLARTCLILVFGKEKVGTNAGCHIERDSTKRRMPWRETFKKAFARTSRMLKRIVLVTVPIYVGVVLMSKYGVFTAWRNSMPEFLTPYFSPEVMTVMFARLGGFVSAASVAMELSDKGVISVAQILLAFFAGNLVTNPIRTVRRNLPSALGIFPGKDGFWIVMILQVSRFATALLVLMVLLVILKG